VTRDPSIAFRFSTANSAGTYVLASSLPSFILDAIINLPHFLVAVRNGLVPVTPTRTISADQLPLPVTQQKVAAKTHEGLVPPSPAPAKIELAATATTEAQDEDSDSGDEKQSSLQSKDDADVESNAGDASVGSSWVNLHEKHE
jgi:hypothetical protein